MVEILYVSGVSIQPSVRSGLYLISCFLDHCDTYFVG